MKKETYTKLKKQFEDEYKKALEISAELEALTNSRPA